MTLIFGNNCEQLLMNTYIGWPPIASEWRIRSPNGTLSETIQLGSAVRWAFNLPVLKKMMGLFGSLSPDQLVRFKLVREKK